MFEKNNNVKKVEFHVDKLYQKKDILLSSSFVAMVNNNHLIEALNEKNDYQNNIVIYLNQKHENSVKKQYNPLIVNLYHDGKLVINTIEYNLKDFFIVFDSNKNDFNVMCINPKYENSVSNYNKAVRFIDTTSFINFIKNNTVANNKIIIDNNDKLIDTIKKWDGYIHSEVLETDSIINKKMTKDVNHE